MSLTIQQILLDSERLASRLKEDDSAADVLLSQTQTVYKQIDAMKQYSEETGELNELARQRPHSVLVAGIQQESRHLRELQQENKELRAALEDHQNALEVIMSKYRQQITNLVQVSKLNLTNLYNNQYTQIIRRQAEKMSEMAAVMKMAAEIDEKNATQDREIVSRLSTENEGLRELLDISYKFGSAKSKNEEESKEKDKEKVGIVEAEVNVNNEKVEQNENVKEGEVKVKNEKDNYLDKEAKVEVNEKIVIDKKQDKKIKNFPASSATAVITAATTTAVAATPGTTTSSSSTPSSPKSLSSSSTSSSSSSAVTSTMKRNSNINTKLQS